MKFQLYAIAMVSRILLGLVLSVPSGFKSILDFFFLKTFIEYSRSPLSEFPSFLVVPYSLLLLKSTSKFAMNLFNALPKYGKSRKLEGFLHITVKIVRSKV